MAYINQEEAICSYTWGEEETIYTLSTSTKKPSSACERRQPSLIAAESALSAFSVVKRAGPLGFYALGSSKNKNPKWELMLVICDCPEISNHGICRAFYMVQVQPPLIY